jgi:hypothetical protein
MCQTSLPALSDWLVRKWYRCQEAKREAETELQKIGIPVGTLREQWVLQVKSQTKPTPRQYPVCLSALASTDYRAIQARREAGGGSLDHS